MRVERGRPPSPLSQRILAAFLAGWAFTAFALLLFSVSGFQETAFRYESALLERITVQLGELITRVEISAPEQGGTKKHLLSLARRFHEIHPDLDVYILSASGEILETLSSSSSNRVTDWVTLDPIRTVADHRAGGVPLCSIDPVSGNSCSAFSAARLGDRFLYIVAAHGIGRFLSEVRGWRAMVQQLFPGFLFGLLFILATAISLSRFLTGELSRFAGVVRRYIAGDYSVRFPAVRSQELSALGGSISALAETVSTEERRLQVSSEEQTRTLASILHDLLRPVSSLRLAVENLGRDGGDGRLSETAERKEQLQRILESEGELLSVLEQIGEEGNEIQEEAPFSFAELLRQAALPFRERATSAGLDLRLELDENVPRGSGDAHQLKRVFSNLIDNAIAYSPNGGTISLRLRSQERLALVEVADEGIGISPYDAERVFSEFYRTASGREQNPKGTGIGLSTARKIILEHGGEIAIAPRDGKGTVVRCVLPTEENRFVRQAAPEYESKHEAQTIVLGSRRFPLFEGIAVLMVLVLAFCLPGSLWRSWRALTWLLCAGIVVLGTIRLKPAPQRELSLFALGCLLSAPGFQLVLLTRNALSLVTVCTLSILAGIGRGAKTTRNERIAVFGGYVVPVLLLVGVRHRLLETLLPLGCFLCGKALRSAVNEGGYRRLSLRAFPIIAVLLVAAVFVQSYFNAIGYEQLFFAEVPAVTKETAEALFAELKSGDDRSGTPPSSEDLTRKMVTMGFLTPRIDMLLTHNGSTVASSPWYDDLEPAGERTFEQTVAPTGTESRKLVLRSESSFSRTLMRKLGQRALVLSTAFGSLSAVVAAFLLAFFTLRPIERRLRGLEQTIDRLGQETIEQNSEPDTPRDEIAELSSAVAVLHRLILSKRQELLGRFRRTAEIVSLTRRALISPYEALTRSITEAGLPQTESQLARFRQLNEQQAAIVNRVFDLCVPESAIPPLETVLPLHEAITDSLLSAAAQLEGPPPSFQIDVPESLAVTGDAENLQRLFSATFDASLRLLPEALHIGAEKGDHTLWLTISGPPGEPDPAGKLSWIVAEELARRTGNTAELMQQQAQITMRLGFDCV